MSLRTQGEPLRNSTDCHLGTDCRHQHPGQLRGQESRPRRSISKIWGQDARLCFKVKSNKNLNIGRLLSFTMFQSKPVRVSTVILILSARKPRPRWATNLVSYKTEWQSHGLKPVLQLTDSSGT